MIPRDKKTDSTNENFFNILAPITHADARHLADLKKAGADELYCGYLSAELTSRWPAAFNVLNRRGDKQSFEDYREFRKAARQARALQLPLYVTVNGLYTPEQYPLLLEMIRRIEDTPGVEGVIVADVGLLLTLRQNGFSKEIHMSTGGTSFNAGTADFYAGLGVTRVVLDRQLTAREIRDITLNIRSGVQCEIFILREGCGGFIDGFCTFFHCMETEKHFLNEKMETIFSYHARPYSRGCSYFFDNAVDVCDARTGRPAGRTLDYRKSPANRYDPLCRLCDLYALRDCPVKSLKIVGRGTDNGTVLRSVRTVAKARAYCRKGALNEQQYRHKSRELIREFLGKPCAGERCYFPPVWGRQ